MSIEMENPTTLLEKVHAAANLVEHMYLAHQIKDESHFLKSKEKASQLLFESVQILNEAQAIPLSVKSTK